MMFRGDGMLSVEAFGERIRSLRIERNLTQQELADRLFVSRKTIGNWESGSCLPDISTLSALARILGVKTYELLDEMFTDEDGSPIVIVVEKERLILRSFVQLIRSALPEAKIFGFDSFSEVQHLVNGLAWGYDKVARDVIAGKYGNDQARINALTAAGYDARLVQDIVNGMLMK